MRTRSALRVAALLALVTAAPSYAAEYEIDPTHTTAAFSVRHLMVSNVKGSISTAKGVVNWDPADPSKSTVEVTLDPNTIDTDNQKRDEHLRSGDFFDTAKFPTMTYKSRKVTSSKAGSLTVVGDLTLHGVTKEVVLNVEGPTAEIVDPWGKKRVGASATAKVNRKDFGLVWNKILETGGVAVGEEIAITIDVELTRS